MSSKYFFNYKNKKISSCKLRNHTDLSCLALYLLNQQTYLLLISNPIFCSIYTQAMESYITTLSEILVPTSPGIAKSQSPRRNLTP